MNRERIAVDLDDVLAANVESFISFSNKNFGTSLTWKNYHHSWAEMWGVDEAEAERRNLMFHNAENFMNFQAIPKAQEALQYLGKKYDLYLVTARRKISIDLTFEWLNAHFANVFQGVHFVPIWEPNNTLTKADICQDIGAEYLIDDLAKHCNPAAKAGIKAILFGDYDWNRDEDVVPGVIRCANWQEVLAYFKSL